MLDLDFPLTKLPQLLSSPRTVCSCLALAIVTFYSGLIQADDNGANENTKWVSALDDTQINRTGDWIETSFRYAARPHLFTNSNKAALEFPFDGTAVAIRLGNHAVPAYGIPNRGKLVASIDGKITRVIQPLASPREIVITRNLKQGPHLLRIEHQADGTNSGCRVEGFRAFDKPTSDLFFNLSGEENAFLVDARAVLRKDGEIIRDTLVRNWRTGQCSLVGLTPSKNYSLEIRAIGWQTTHIDNITIGSGTKSVIDPVFLKRDPSTVISRFRFPALNRQAIRKPGQSFRARFLAFRSEIDKVVLRRTVGPAVISRTLQFEEDQRAAYYYDREIIAKLPADMPPGIYDLSIQITNKSPSGKRTGICSSSRSVHVVSKFPSEPVLVTFGHLDTAGQYQAEYLERLADMTNLLAADLVLNSNAVNPAYISGALTKLDMPYVINFGNHQFYGHEKWYGDPVGLINFGPKLSVLNFGHPWHDDSSKADALLASRPDCQYKIINAFEANAPLELLNQNRICMIHDAHGIGEKVMPLGSTPTLRIGKVNAVSFRVVRLKNGRVISSTYNGHKTAPIPFGREEASPLRVQFEPANDGTHNNVTATVTNDYLEDYPQCRLTFVLPNGQYSVNKGAIESSITSDDQKYVILSIRVDLPAKKSTVVRVHHQEHSRRK